MHSTGSEEFLMEENYTAGGEAAPKNKMLAWLDNFWYHYKWHSLIALFLVFTISVCTLQMCNKEEYDVYIVYAGQKEIKRTSNGGFSEYQLITSSLEQISGDFDESGDTLVSLLDLFMLSNKEIKEVEANDDYEVNYTLLRENQEKFYDTMLYSSYYVCLLSDTLYEEYREISGVKVFAPLSPYVGEGDYKYLDEGAVYLHGSGLSFAELPGIKELPDNTVICIRTLSAVASHFSKEENEELFKRSEEVLREMLVTRLP